ncbi:P-II family nitrogen regulator [Vallitalea okinawensis]|uniref:P-II family nitrogen regulator n=1 Tax=Vallitalea okinawensis TaxID=2078660 RepID=UPI000CFB14E0|nr:P-II family nitrogen regulator [Vallitalea okinawensis]
MVEQRYMLFIVLNRVKKTKSIIKRLKEIGIDRFTLMNTFGSYNLCGKGQGYEPIIAGSYKSSMSHIKRNYNKTFFIALNSEEEAQRVMDEIEVILHMDSHKPGDGIMFTVPVLTTKGVREQVVE